MKPGEKPLTERANTDESLRVERGKTDEEIARRRDAVEEDANEVVQAARERADALLEKGRAQADARLDTEVLPDGVRTELATERRREDAGLRRERNVADAALTEERDERTRALASLLHFERETTDRHLLVERDRADAAVATRDDFLGMVSHDLRTLLGGIAFEAALLLRDAPEDEAGRRIQRTGQHVQRYVARMNRLVSDLLDVVSIEAGKLHVEPTDHDAVQLMREVIETFQPTAAAKGITLSTEIARGSLLAKFDHERILQVLANLVSNAIKFTDAGGTIDVRVEPVEHEVCFSVADTGTGIPPALLGAVFERFWQSGQSDQTAHRGLGLGLYISRCIVEAHQGRIWVESEVGKGSTFRFTLPGAPRA